MYIDPGIQKLPNCHNLDSNQSIFNGTHYCIRKNVPGKIFSPPTSTVDPLQKFLALDRVVLRFYAIWDDREQLFGEVRKFIVHFYMSDDTLEIREVHQPNNGRDPFPILIARQRMPKKLIPKTYPSVEREIIEEQSGFFEASDLIVGKTIGINGRNMLLYDCDEATRKFAQGKF